MPYYCIIALSVQLLQPHREKTFDSHKVIKRLMKTIFLRRPTNGKHFVLWRVHKLLKLLERMGPIGSLTLKQLTWKTTCLVSLATSKRMVDMSIMGIQSENMYVCRDHIQFHLLFGSKTDGPNHLSSAI